MRENFGRVTKRHAPLTTSATDAAAIQYARSEGRAAAQVLREQPSPLSPIGKRHTTKSYTSWSWRRGSAAVLPQENRASIHPA